MSVQLERDKNPASPISGLCAVPGFGTEGQASYLAQQQNRLPAFGILQNCFVVKVFFSLCWKFKWQKVCLSYKL